VFGSGATPEALGPVQQNTSWSGGIDALGTPTTFTSVLAYYQEPSIVTNPAYPDAFDSWWVGLGNCGNCGQTGDLNQGGTFPSGLPGYFEPHQAWLQTLNGVAPGPGSCNFIDAIPWFTNAGDIVGVGILYQGNGFYEYA
jgi:hypothetical protein